MSFKRKTPFYFGLFLSACGLLSAADTRPNILIIMTDQLTHSAMSNAGNPHLKTPGMDRIAQDGVRFAKTYVTQPLCGPARTSLYTGKFPHQTTVLQNGGTGNKDFIPLGKAMSDAGYHTEYHGKWHVAYDGEAMHDTFVGSKGDTKAADRAVKFLKSPGDKPFYLFVSFSNPHDICQMVRFLGGINKKRTSKLPEGPIPEFPSDDKLPPLPANFGELKSDLAILDEVKAWQKDYHYPTDKYTEKTWRQYLWAYYRLVEKVDREVVRVLDALKESGKEDNTVIIFTSDHGEGVASHHWTQKQVLYDESIHVPLLISYKGKSVSNVVNSTHQVSNCLDVYPTVLDFAGVKIPDHFEGHSLKPLVMGEKVSAWRDFIIVQTRFARGEGYSGINGRTLITDDYKYIVYNKDGKPAGEQFFDVNKDPGETKNLVTDAKYTAKANKYRKMLKDWQAAAGDTKEVQVEWAPCPDH
jgi:arylsulfatase A-like enzyme